MALFPFFHLVRSTYRVPNGTYRARQRISCVIWAVNRRDIESLRFRDMLGYTKRDMDGKAVVIWKAKGFRDMASLALQREGIKGERWLFYNTLPIHAFGGSGTLVLTSAPVFSFFYFYVTILYISSIFGDATVKLMYLPSYSKGTLSSLGR